MDLDKEVMLLRKGLAAAHEGALAVWIDRALGDRLHVNVAAGVATILAADLPTQPAARSAFLQRVCQRLAVPAPSQRAAQQWLALGDRGEARLHGLTVVGNGILWQFFVKNVARPPLAD